MRDTEKYRKGKESLKEVLTGKHYKDQFVKVYGLKGLFSIYNTETNRCIVGVRNTLQTSANPPMVYVQDNSWYAPYLSRYFAGKGYLVQKTDSSSTNWVNGASKAYKKIERWTK